MDPIAQLKTNQALFEEMLALAKEQRQAILGDRTELFFSLASRRGEIERRIVRNQEAGRGIFPGRPGGAQEDLERNAVSARIADLIRAIQQIDRETEACIAEKRERSLAEVQKIRHGQKALRGYKGPSAPPPRFVQRHT
jgi:hypothetical protein